MSWSMSLPHFFHGGGRQDHGQMMKELTVSVHENYFTFKGWDEGDRTTEGRQESLPEKLCKNFATFRQWGS